MAHESVIKRDKKVHSIEKLFSGATRDITGDRPELILPCPAKQGDITIPQQVGFIAENGTPFQMSLDRAIAMGLLGVGDVMRASMKSEDWRVSLNKTSQP